MSQGGGVRGAQYFNAFHGAIRELYDINPLASETKTLATGEGKFKSVLNAAEKAFKKVYKDGYKPTDLLTVNEFANLITETKAVFDPALEFVQSDVLKSYLDQDVFVFSGLKAHKQLTQARSLLKDDKGAIRPYYQFQQEIVKLNNSYNKLYLEAEYEFAVQSAQSADQWSNLNDDTERYLLQYRTAQDERVREDHQALAGTTLPKDDPFWDSYYPPNGWRCRCVAIEVLAGKYPTSNSAEAIAKGETATTAISKSGGNKLAMFRFNPGKQQVIFPPNHPYKKVPEGVTEAIDKLYEKAQVKPTDNPNAFKISKDVKSIDDLNDVMTEFAKAKPEYFKRGFKKIRDNWSEGDHNAETDKYGTIGLHPTKKLPHVIEAFNNIKTGKKLTLVQEDAIGTLWHEIHHNSSKFPIDYKTTQKQVDLMELSNEFVSRKTLPDFFTMLGSKLNNMELTLNRANGYNSSVRNFEKLIKYVDADYEGVLKMVKSSNIKATETGHGEALAKALIKNTKRKYDKNELSQALNNATLASEDSYEKILKLILYEVK